MKKFLLTLLILFIGCAPKQLYRHYEGNPLPKGKVGFVMGHDSYRDGGKTRNTILIITSINDQSIPEAISVELLPGEYKLGGYYVQPFAHIDYYTYFNFLLRVEKGVEYKLGVRLDFKNQKANYYYDRRAVSSSSNKSKRIFLN